MHFSAQASHFSLPLSVVLEMAVGLRLEYAG